MSAVRPSPGDRLAVQVATLGPVGRMPFAPGTWGSAAALLLAPWLFLPLSLPLRCLALAVVFALGTWAAGRAEDVLERNDPGCVVIDEVLGQWTAFLPLAHPGAWTLLAGLALFRILDILKPWPIRWVERRFQGGLGVMADDLLAGALAAALLWFLAPYLHGL